MDTFDIDDILDEQNAPEVPSEEQPQEDRKPAADIPEAPVYTAPAAAPEQDPWQQPREVYRGAGAGRKESPFANSPYQRMEPETNSYRYQPENQKPRKEPKVKKAKKPVWKPILAIFLAVLLAAGSSVATAAVVDELWEERHENAMDALGDEIEALRREISSMPTDIGVSVPLAEGEGYSPGQLYANCVNSVVAISCTISSTSFYGSYGESSGSGFVLSEDGYILTNYHVVEGASEITVITHDGSSYPAQLVGYDSSTNDLAVLKAEATGLQAAKIGKSSDVAIGDMVAAIGNPLGELTSTQTVGYVSGIGREVATDSLTTISMIQTDAAINPGNSGGPLFNMRGEVIGITTAKYSGTTNSGASIEGIGFAIPIDDVMRVVDDLIEFGYVNGAYMGVSVQNTDEASAAMFDLPTGAYIVSVEQGGAADRAGIRAKDIVVQVGEYSVSNVTDLTRALRNFKAGDVTTVKVIRSGAPLELEITLDARPQETASTEPEQSVPVSPEGNYEEWFDYFRRYFGG